MTETRLPIDTDRQDRQKGTHHLRKGTESKGEKAKCQSEKEKTRGSGKEGNPKMRAQGKGTFYPHEEERVSQRKTVR